MSDRIYIAAPTRELAESTAAAEQVESWTWVGNTLTLAGFVGVELWVHRDSEAHPFPEREAIMRLAAAHGHITRELAP